MKLREILGTVPVEELCADPTLEIRGITADSRQVRPGFLFLAVPGFQVDGHDFVPQALAAGAVCAVTQRAVEGIPFVRVESTYAAMAGLAANFYGHPSRALTLVGITGTNGKSTTTYLLKRILEQCLGAKVGLIGTNQNLIGEEAIPTSNTTPDGVTLQALFSRMVEKGCTHCVMEVSSHALAQGRVDQADFDIGVFTNLTQDHLDYHKTMENYRAAKARLFQLCKKGAFNLDDGAAEAMMETASCEKFTYSVGRREADLAAENVRYYPDGIRFEAVCGSEIARVTLGIPGKFSVYNALSALSAGRLLGLSLTEMAAALAGAQGVKGRVEVVPTPGDFTVLIDYAHTPDSLENVLQALREVQSGRLVVLFGCGGDRDRGKRPKMGRIAGENADFVVVTTDNPRTEEPGAIIGEILAGMEGFEKKYQVVEDRRAAIVWALDHALPGDTILLAGKGHETYQEINHVKHHLDEREEVRKYFEKRDHSGTGK